MPGVGDYQAYADQVADRYGIPRAIFRRQIDAESNWNPDAVSDRGAVGLGQLMPGTAQQLGVNPYDWRQNLDGSGRYLAQQYNRFGSWKNALAAYNAGPGNVEKYGGVPPFAETRNYIDKILKGVEDTVRDMPSPMPGLSVGNAIDGFQMVEKTTRSWTDAIVDFFSRDTLIRGVAIVVGVFLLVAAVLTFIAQSKAGKAVMNVAVKGAKAVATDGASLVTDAL